MTMVGRIWNTSIWVQSNPINTIFRENLALAAGAVHTFNKELLTANKCHNQGKYCQQQNGIVFHLHCHCRDLSNTLTKCDEFLNLHHQGRTNVQLGHTGYQCVIPVVNGWEQKDGYQNRNNIGKHNLPVNLERIAAIQLCSFFQISRHAGKELAEQEDENASL